MITVESLSKTFSSPAGEVTALKDATFSVKTGEFVSIVGKSGSGKSTLLSLLGALDTPSAGDIIVDDISLRALNDAAQTAYRAKKIGFVFQQYHLIPNLTALENVLLTLEFGNYPKQARLDRATQLLHQVGLTPDQFTRKPSRLSGGQQQRVSIARALANQPAYILADEPTGNLDAGTGKKIFSLLHELSRSQNTTIIVVTHDLDIAGKTDRTYTLSDGKITTKKSQILRFASA